MKNLQSYRWSTLQSNNYNKRQKMRVVCQTLLCFLGQILLTLHEIHLYKSVQFSVSEVLNRFSRVDSTTQWSPPGFAVRGISQARILEWVAISRRSAQPRDRTHGSWPPRRVLDHQHHLESPVQFSDYCLFTVIQPSPLITEHFSSVQSLSRIRLFATP